MIAMRIIIGTEYDCNLHYKVDQILLQSLSKRTKYDCNSRDSRTNFNIAIIFGPF